MAFSEEEEKMKTTTAQNTNPEHKQQHEAELFFQAPPLLAHCSLFKGPDELGQSEPNSHGECETMLGVSGLVDQTAGPTPCGILPKSSLDGMVTGSGSLGRPYRLPEHSATTWTT